MAKMKYPFRIMNKKKFATSFVLAFITNVCIYIFPLLLAIFTKEPFTIDKLKNLIIWVIVVKVLYLVLNHIWIIAILRFEELNSRDIQLGYFNRVIRMKPNKLNKLHNGFLKKQIDIVATESEEYIESIFETVNGFLISAAIFLYEVYTQDVKMFFVCLAFFLLMLTYNYFLGKKVVEVQEDYNESTSNYNATYVDFLQNSKTVKRLGAGKFANKKNHESFEKVIPNMNRKNILLSFRYNGVEFFIYFMYVVILINLHFKMRNGQNILSYLLFYGTIFNGIIVELRDLSRLFIHKNKFDAAADKLEKIIGNDEEKRLIKKWNKVEISNLNYKYNDESKITISIPKFEITKGENVSIIGVSGQGKSTFLNIFARYLEIEDPSCYKIDGKVCHDSLDIVYVAQDIDLFNLSLRDNLCLGKDISDEKLNELLQEAGLLEWISKLENGLDTIVGEKGLKLSAGQKQRINILRGLLLDKDIYLLDEPTSNLDKETEKLIINLIYKYLDKKTLLIVTHREPIQAICSRHYEFENNIMKEI